MNRARRQQYMLRTEASEQEAVITIMETGSCQKNRRNF